MAQDTGFNACETIWYNRYGSCGFWLLQYSWKAGLVYASLCETLLKGEDTPLLVCQRRDAPLVQEWTLRTEYTAGSKDNRPCEHRTLWWLLVSVEFLNKYFKLKWHIVVHVGGRDVSGDGVVFAAEAAVHTGAWSQSHTLLFLCLVAAEIHHILLRQRLRHTKENSC